MKKLRRAALVFCVALLTLPISVATVGAAPDATPAWPTHPVKIVVGFPGGSTPDMAARVLADVLAKAWGHAVVVDNRPGAAGNLAAGAVAKAVDDHTLGVVINGNLSTARLLNPRLPFDPARDFRLLSLLATAPLVLVTSASQPAGPMFFNAARAAGTQWNYGSVGAGSVGHLGMEVLKARAGFDAVHVPYNGNPAVLTALMAGQLQAALVPPGVALAQVRAGRLQAIGVAGGRSLLAPEVPPLSDLGVNVGTLEVWVALVGPASLSQAAQDRLLQDLPRLREGEARQRLFNAGWQVQASAPDALRQRVRAEAELLGGIIQRQGIRAD